MTSKYEEIYEDYLKSGLKFKKYCEINNLNYHNTQTGIYHFRKKKELENKGMKIIEVKDEIEENNLINFKINEVDCLIKYKNYSELELIIKAIKNV